ncbi:MAG: BtpA/SgcQ family protein [Clostridiales bacterium]|jgi:membrane complex biogenesis BtpA family protein|nr:BtpA/SgcQ family protein [Eubacteriales bacterium]MDH7565774.1 BtpA/SgcQ family protein [Clostridiales bacterium]
MSGSDFIERGRQFVIGMVHCLPLPGMPGFCGDMKKVIDQAVHDAITLEQSGMDAIIVENMGDNPFGVVLDTEQSCALAVVSANVAQKVKIPIGIDAAMNDYKTSFSIAKAIDGAFVRIPVFVDTVEFFGGIIRPCAREAMIFRKNLQAENIKILADIQVKHTHMVLPHVSIEDSAKAAESCGADGIIVTGTHMGVETPIEIIQRVRKVTRLPLIAGSGVKTTNIKEQLSIADGAIVGSSLKEGGAVENPVSLELAKDLINALRG